MKHVDGMVHDVLQCTVEMGKGFGAAGETERLAEVVSTGFAIIAIVAHDACLNGDPLAWGQRGYPWGYRRHYPGGFMAKNERGAKCKVAVSTVHVIVHYNRG